jgi:predicted amidohydrolase
MNTVSLCYFFANSTHGKLTGNSYTILFALGRFHSQHGYVEEKIAQIHEHTDLIILPEMFTTGFSMNAAALAEPMNLTTFKWMKGQAAQTGAVITGSYIVKEKDAFYNRLIWMRPDGSYELYDKRHLFRMAEEHHTYAAGTNRIIPVLKGWRICPLICYDLTFSGMEPQPPAYFG